MYFCLSEIVCNQIGSWQLGQVFSVSNFFSHFLSSTLSYLRVCVCLPACLSDSFSASLYLSLCASVSVYEGGGMGGMGWGLLVFLYSPSFSTAAVSFAEVLVVLLHPRPLH